MGKLRHIGYIAYNYPPVGGSGVYRSAKMTRYLAELGWQVTVLSCRRTFTGNRDESLYREIMDAGVHVEELGGAFHEITRGLRWLVAGKSVKGDGLRNRIREALGWRTERVVNRLGRYVLCPDECRLWAHYATRAFLRHHSKYPFDAIVTTSDPWSAHLVGRAAKRALGIRWVADFRDIWLGDYTCHPPTRIHTRVQGMMEASVVSEADIVVQTTDAATILYRRRYARLPASKFVTIWNGHDLPVNHPTSPPTICDDGRFFLYAGSLHSTRFIPALFRAARSLRELNEGVKLRFIGTQCEEAVGLVGDEGLCDVVSLEPYMEKQAVERLMVGAIGLICILNDVVNEEIFVPAKLFDYAATGRPILLLGSRGSEAARVLDALEAGTVVDRKDERAIRSWLLRNARKPPESRTNDRLKEYSRYNQAVKLSKLLGA